MNSDSSVKYAFYTFLATLFTASASAQEGILQQPILGGGSAGALDTINSFLLYEIVTWQHLGIFIAIWAGFYFALKFIMNEVFHFVSQHFPSAGGNSHLPTGDDDEIPVGVKGFSVAAGFVAAQYVGWIIGGAALIIIAVVALLLPLVVTILGGRTAYENMRNNLNDVATDGGVEADRGTQTPTGPTGPEGPGQQVPEELAQDLNDLANRVEGLEGDYGDLDSEFEDLESDLQGVIERLNQFNGLEEEIREKFRALRNEIGEVESQTQKVDQLINELTTDVEDLKQFRERVSDMVQRGSLTEEQARQVKELIVEEVEAETLEEQIEAIVEKVLDNEEGIVEVEGRVDDMEEKIDNLEQRVTKEFELVLKDIESLAEDQNEADRIISSLQSQVQNNSEAANQFENEIESAWAHIKSLEDQGRHVMEDLAKVRAEIQEMDQMLNDLKEGMPGEELDERLDSMEERLTQAEQKEEQAERMLTEEKERESKLPDQMREVFVEDEEEIIEKLEERETQEEEEIVNQEEYIEALERELGQGEMEVGQQLEKDLERIERIVQLMRKAINRDKLLMEQIEEIVERKRRVTEGNITEVRKHLQQIRDGKINNISPVEQERIVKEYVRELRALKRNAQDSDQIGKIREALSLAERIIEREEYEIKQDSEHEEIAERMALENEKRRKMLESGDPTPEQLGKELKREFGERLKLARETDFRNFSQVRLFWINNQALIEDFQNINTRLPEEISYEIGDLEHELQEYLEKEAENHGGSLGGPIQ